MNRNQKAWVLIGSIVMCFIFAATGPVIQLYFMQLISAKVLAISNMLSVAIAAMTNSTVTIDKCMQFYRSHFKWIVVVDVVCFSLISFTGLEYPTVRFIGLALLNAISTTLWCVVINNAINQLVHGDQLTTWQSFNSSINLYASLCGSIVLLCIDTIPIDVALALQCAGNLFMGITDVKAFSKLQKGKETMKESQVNVDEC